MHVKSVAFYLPQFHPIPENDAWWGVGFTEWTKVVKAKPLYPGHQQPLLPADLGFYDLRVPEVREQQTVLARRAGISAFAYWHYWFGDGRRLLELPLQQVLRTGRPDFPFCLAWANETWTGRWHGLDNEVLIEQSYGGVSDQKSFFYDCLPYFRDRRYAEFGGRKLFIVYRPFSIPGLTGYLNSWRKLGCEEGLDFYLVGMGDRRCLDFGFDGFVSNGPVIPKHYLRKAIYRAVHGRRIGTKSLGLPEVFDYGSVAEQLLNEPLIEGEHPLVVPNWDNTPRCGRRGMVLANSTPELFGNLLQKARDRVLESREDRIIFIKSWNEWAEGNVLEPSERWQRSYIDICRQILCPDGNTVRTTNV